MEAIEEDQPHEEQQGSEAAAAAGGGGDPEFRTPSFPIGRVKKIMKLDRDIKKVNSEALLLITLSAELFLESLAERARDAALAKKRRIIKADHLRSAVRSHPPTSDFLLDCLPKPSSEEAASAVARSRSAKQVKPLPAGARRMEDFFGKAKAASS